MESDARVDGAVRVGLVAALLVAMGLSVLFFQGERGLLIPAETMSVVAMVLLLVFREGKGRLAAAIVTFVAALLPTCEGVMIAHYPGGDRGPVPPSSVPLVAANLAVLVLAALHFKGDDRRALLIVTGLVVVAICVIDLLFR